jgi:hypothetical protein
VDAAVEYCELFARDFAARVERQRAKEARGDASDAPDLVDMLKDTNLKRQLAPLRARIYAGVEPEMRDSFDLGFIEMMRFHCMIVPAE